MTANNSSMALHEAMPGLPLGPAIADWGLLLAAVHDRLRSLAGDRTGTLECVAELNMLHAAIGLQLGRCRQLEVEHADLQFALKQARAELAGTRQQEQRVLHLALRDSLTGLANRRHFCEQLDRLLVSEGPPRTGLAVMYLDLDDLKSINDVHGDDTGDELLGVVATRLRWALRAQDLVGRLGGDEFACLVSGPLTRDELTQRACKLFDTVSAPVRVGLCRLVVRPSIGIATCPEEGATAAVMLKQACAAMYSAKRTQTGYAFFGEAANLQFRPVATAAMTPARAALPATPPRWSMIGSAPG